MKTAIYIRVSTEEQAKEGYSISAQTQKLKAFCISQEWDVVGLYADEGISAKDMNRPQLQRMLKDIRNGLVDCVLVYRLDRLTRSVLDLYKMLEIFEQYECKFKSATEVYDTTTAMGRMFITIVAALAQWERENMGERIAFGFSEKARQGKWPMNFAPLGYDLNKEESKLYINHSEAKIVRYIFDLYIGGLGMNTVAKRLNKEKIYTKANNPWSDNTVMKILRSHPVRGAVKWNDMIIENTHEPIIDKDTWELAQQLISERARKPPRAVSSRYIFSSKLKCPSCGKNMTGNYTKWKNKDGSEMEHLYYRCRDRLSGFCDYRKSVSEAKVERAFINYLEKIDPEKVLDEMATLGVSKFNKKDDREVDYDELEKRLKKIENRKKKWQYAWTEDVMTYEDFKSRMEEATQEENEIRELLSSSEVEEKDPVNKSEVISALKNIKRNWNTLNDGQKKSLVDSVIKTIHYAYIDNKFYVTHIEFID